MVDLPALVYPTKQMSGIWLFKRRLRCVARAFSSVSRFRLSLRIAFSIWRVSRSLSVSPGPRLPITPPVEKDKFLGLPNVIYQIGASQ